MLGDGISPVFWLRSNAVLATRQAILDSSHGTVGYEVLAHSQGEHAGSPEIAAVSLLQNPAVARDITALAGSRPLYLPVDPQLLSPGVSAILSPERTILEIPASNASIPGVVEAARSLKSHGFKIALNGATTVHIFSPLARMADIAKVDVASQWLPSWRLIAKRFTHTGTPIIATSADRPEDLPTLRELGFGYFQGTYFARPSPVGPRTISATKASVLALITELRKPELDLDGISNAISVDLALSYKLLTVVNSAAVGLRQHVTSVRHAAGMLGAEALRKWLCVAAVQQMAEDKPEELVLQSLIRAAFCETFARRESLSSRASELYLMGLFSLIDAILDRPMTEILSRLPLSPGIRTALQGGQNAARLVLNLVIAYERANWAEVEGLMERTFQQELDIAGAYRKAVSEATVALSGS